MMSLEFLRHLKSSQTSQENFSLWNKPVTNTDARFTSDVCSIVLTRLSRCNLVKSKPISTGLNQFMLLAITISISDYNCWYLVSVLVKLHQEKAWEMQGTTNSPCKHKIHRDVVRIWMTSKQVKIKVSKQSYSFDVLLNLLCVKTAFSFQLMF